MKKIIISTLVFLLVIAGIFIATQEETNSQSQQTEQIETERLRNQLLAFPENKEEYDPRIYYKVVDNVEDTEMQFLKLAAELEIEKQYIGTDVIWTAISSTQEWSTIGMNRNNSSVCPELLMASTTSPCAITPRSP